MRSTWGRLLLLVLTAAALGWAPFHFFPVFRSPGPPAGGAAAFKPLPVSPETAEAARRCDLETVRQNLEPMTALETAGGQASRVLLGIYANACSVHEVAVHLLSANEDPFGVVEDLRLWLLAESAGEAGRNEVAQEALTRLISDHPGSWLAADARLAAAALARDRGEPDIVFTMAYQARLLGGRSEPDEQLERLAWEVALASGDHQELFAAGRQLLTRFPLAADELSVVSRFRAPDGSVRWSSLLTPSQLVGRAEQLLDLRQPAEAEVALRTVPESYRDTRWTLLLARSLTDSHRGVEALELLENIGSVDTRGELELAFARARAAHDAATLRRGRRNLSPESREEMLHTAHQELWKVYRLDKGRDTSVAALRLLYEGLRRDNPQEARRVLELLKRLAPNDTLGAQDLWEAGWKRYLDGSLESAIDFFEDISYLYPGTAIDRQATYWRARSFAGSGHLTEAQTLYRRLLSADTRDFYSRFALPLLAEKPGTSFARPGSRPEPWPTDPVLDRARLLTEAGLDRLAEREIEALAAEADGAAAAGLRSLALARQGRRRESISLLRRVFPALGSSYQSGVPEDALQLYYPLDFFETILELSHQREVPPELLLAMVRQESAFDPQARSWAGARGLMQIMPATAREMAQRIGLPYSTSRLTDPEFSLQLGSAYFAQVLRMFENDVELSLAAYNAGPTRIRRLLRAAGGEVEVDFFLENLSYEEPRTYVKRIVLFSDSYRQLYSLDERDRPTAGRS